VFAEKEPHGVSTYSGVGFGRNIGPLYSWSNWQTWSCISCDIQFGSVPSLRSEKTLFGLLPSNRVEVIRGTSSLFLSYHFQYHLNFHVVTAASIRISFHTLIDSHSFTTQSVFPCWCCIQIVVFTASQRVYADRLLDLLDPKKTYIHHRLFRDSCLCVQGNFIKDLEVTNRDLAKVPTEGRGAPPYVWAWISSLLSESVRIIVMYPSHQSQSPFHYLHSTSLPCSCSSDDVCVRLYWSIIPHMPTVTKSVTEFRSNLGLMMTRTPSFWN